MNTRTTYNGFVLEATPKQVLDDKRWTTEVRIERHTAGAVESQPFNAANTWENQDDAIKHSWNFGMMIIDGRVEGCEAP